MDEKGNKTVIQGKSVDGYPFSSFAETDWYHTPFGDPATWPVSLKLFAQLVLESPEPRLLLWGPALLQIANSAVGDLAGAHLSIPAGTSAKDFWPTDLQHLIPDIEYVLNTGNAVQWPGSSGQASQGIAATGQFPHPESASAVRDESGKISGVMLCFDQKPMMPESHRRWVPIDNLYERWMNEIQDYAIILLDANGMIQNWNKGAENIKQYTEPEVIGKSFEMFYLPEDRAGGLAQKLLKQAATYGRATHEGWRMRKDKSRFWGSVSLTAVHNDAGELIGYSKVTRDLTGRKLSEDRLVDYAAELEGKNEQLRLSEERYHQMIAEVQDYAIILLNKEGMIENWNIGAEKIKGYTAPEIVGKHFSIFYTPDDRDNKLPNRLLNEAASNGRALHEGWRVRKNGTMFWGSIVISALHGADGSLIGYSKVTRDLTERKEAEDKMKQYLLDLEAQNRELEQFAYIASHDLQEPLRKIRTFVDVIETNFDDKDMVLGFFARIKHSTARMTDLIKSILNYSKLTNETPPLAPVDLNAIFAAVCSDLELMMQDKAAEVISDPLPVIDGNTQQLTQLFTNLINNSLKFNTGRPKITISASVLPSHEINRYPANRKPGNYIEVNVSDNGIGFDQRYAEHIFSMFQRLHGKHQYAGTGIGLALCKKIMDIHHGFITADSKPMEGATFHVYFPKP